MKNKKLIIAALSISVLASSAVAQESKPYIIKPFTSKHYCFANSNDCWVEFDASIISENNKEDLSALRADLAEGAQE